MALKHPLLTHLKSACARDWCEAAEIPAVSPRWCGEALVPLKHPLLTSAWCVVGEWSSPVFVALSQVLGCVVGVRLCSCVVFVASGSLVCVWVQPGCPSVVGGGD
jgi:hypothetical protein